MSDAFTYANSQHAPAEEAQRPQGTFVRDNAVDRDDTPATSEREAALSFYGDKMVETRTQAVLDQVPYRAPDGTVIAEEQRAAIAQGLAAASIDLDFSDAELQRFLSMRPLTEAEAQAEEREILKDLEHRYPNPQDRADRIAIAREMAQRHPVLLRILESTRLGSSRAVFDLMLERGWAQRARGR
jgi:hypothetical protein